MASDTKGESALLKSLDWIFVTRPIVLIPAWAFLLAGYLRAHELAGETSAATRPLLVPFGLLTLVLAGVYIVNQIYDRESDKENGKLFLLAEGHIGPRAAWIEAIVLLAIGLAATAALRPALLPGLVAAAALGLLYSVPPVRFKARPLVDLAANAVGYGAVTFLIGYRVGEGEGLPIARTLPYMLIVGGVFLHTALVDEEGDRKAGMRTTAILLGGRSAGIAALLLLVAAAVAGIVVEEPYAALASIGAAPFFVWAVFLPGRKGSTLAYQWGSLLFVLLLVIREPFFGLWLAVLVAATRLYYRFRFGMVYPRLDF